MKLSAITLVLLSAFSALAADAPMGEEAQTRFKKLTAVLGGMTDAKASFYRLDPAGLDKDADPEIPQMHGYAILAEKELTAKDCTELAAILRKEGTYSDMGAKCFDPGMGVRFSFGAEKLECVICLACGWSYWYGKERPVLALSAAGTRELAAFYEKFYPAGPKK